MKQKKENRYKIIPQKSPYNFKVGFYNCKKIDELRQKRMIPRELQENNPVASRQNYSR